MPCTKLYVSKLKFIKRFLFFFGKIIIIIHSLIRAKAPLQSTATHDTFFLMALPPPIFERLTNHPTQAQTPLRHPVLVSFHRAPEVKQPVHSVKLHQPAPTNGLSKPVPRTVLTVGVAALICCNMLRYRNKYIFLNEEIQFMNYKIFFALRVKIKHDI